MVKDLKLPKHVVIGGFVREDKGYITVGTTKFQTDDKVVVFALPETINKIDGFFN